MKKILALSVAVLLSACQNPSVSLFEHGQVSGQVNDIDARIKALENQQAQTRSRFNEVSQARYIPLGTYQANPVERREGWASSMGRYPLPAEGNMIGEITVVTARNGDTCASIAREFGVGYDALEKANLDAKGRGVDCLALRAGEQIFLPTQFVLPDAPRTGVVINLPEMRLYHYPEEGGMVDVYAIGIGREGWRTPEGILKIIEKKANPTWTPPASIRKEHAEKGDILPAVVPAGPDNPLGLFAMRLSNPSYLIHGTHKPDGVGSAVSHGCIRMYPEGIEELFSKVNKGTQVNIVNQPLKIGYDATGNVFLEYHAMFDENTGKLLSARKNLGLINERASQEALQRGTQIDKGMLEAIVNNPTGIPVQVNL